ncbi:MAG: acyltransferase [Candidatus Obscuribacterales bacterium]|nr:acyltransferase [Candidatus Obscuribacterales bacterium]
MSTETLPPVNSKSAPCAEVMLVRPAKLDALTSLRFFAAMLVLCSHAVPAFFPSTLETLETIPLAQGVSFFFVLSGFILTYVHPRLDTMGTSLLFLRARVARVFPAHIVTAALSLGTASISLQHLNKIAWCILVSNVLMLQSWIPQARFYFSLNPPSWSISTEFFFYLAFPFLIQQAQTKHFRNLLLASIPLIGCISLAGFLHLPEPSMSDSMSMRAIIYIHPLARLFEFCLGISCAVLFKNLSQKGMNTKLDRRTASFLEAGIIAAIIIYMLSIFDATRSLQPNSYALALREWLLYDGNCFAFAALIILCAMQKGAVSQLLSGKVLIWLGEISYSLYLLHFVILSYCQRNMATLAQFNPFLLFAAYISLTIVSAHLMFTFIETPMRKWIAGSTKKVSS